MIVDQNITEIDIKMPVDYLKKQLSNQEHNLVDLQDLEPLMPDPGFMFSKTKTLAFYEFCDQLFPFVTDSKIGKVVANSTISWHKDFRTQAKLNFIIDDGGVPLQYREKTYWYKCALINTAKEHQVVTKDRDRLFYSVCFIHNSYEEVQKYLIRQMTNSDISAIQDYINENFI